MNNQICQKRLPTANPLADGRNGLAVVEALEAADRAMHSPQIAQMTQIKN
jgi:hypothetical protein